MKSVNLLSLLLLLSLASSSVLGMTHAPGELSPYQEFMLWKQEFKDSKISRDDYLNLLDKQKQEIDLELAQLRKHNK